ncbi:M48 family metallopeptidase [Phocaeicola coprocola]|uniref:M48 family metallopeptidase n=1 Tax=Phocaeicola coprocola TaxID=310298 RepID=UPI001C38B4DC|nr:SprT family zinc-dependent metalloprotease [Phocaeicola coprocola]MBV3867631.1 M48 family metallopeptidase [Phocaeicola coprocola]MBV4008771.1 M48 family metallopeptidase [Phocaeicola coprocola]MBV4033280.1 M48 family metallopeptidase [Phocaeicola coprocola]MBV4039849.1 M48 family metallopeptidase [Phocaeicola coprocola]MBV4061472.1 M48 family metallopeptidase [Phocaeicola coprocola]
MSKKQIISDKDFGKIHFVVRRSARNITMRVKEDGLHVTTPPYRSITALLEAIAPFRERLRNVCSEVKPKPFDLNFSIEAECFRLKLETSPLKNFTVSMRDETVVIACPAHADFTTDRVQTLVKNAVIRAMRKKAEEYLPPLVQYWSSLFDLPYNKVTISKARSRWGSCSSKRDISLSFYLMLLPAHLMDYVILHELAHTREMNHGPKFWELLNQLTDGKALALRKELRMHRPVF